jgi:hypothetical protein
MCATPQTNMGSGELLGTGEVDELREALTAAFMSASVQPALHLVPSHASRRVKTRVTSAMFFVPQVQSREGLG